PASTFSVGALQYGGVVGVDYDSAGSLYAVDAHFNRVLVYDNPLAPNNFCPGDASNDADGDGYCAGGSFLAPKLGGGDCNDFAAAINPGATEICNGLDDNCDGS